MQKVKCVSRGGYGSMLEGEVGELVEIQPEDTTTNPGVYHWPEYWVVKTKLGNTVAGHAHRFEIIEEIKKEWFGMTTLEARRLSRRDRIMSIRANLCGFRGKEALHRFQSIAGMMSHAETIIADAEFNIFGDEEDEIVTD